MANVFPRRKIAQSDFSRPGLKPKGPVRIAQDAKAPAFAVLYQNNQHTVLQRGGGVIYPSETGGAFTIEDTGKGVNPVLSPITAQVDSWAAPPWVASRARTDGLSILARCRRNSTSGYGPGFGFDDGDANLRRFMVNFFNDGNVYIALENGGTNFTSTASNDTAWHDCGIVEWGAGGGTAAQLYFDGALTNLASTPTALNAGVDVFENCVRFGGSRSTANRHFEFIYVFDYSITKEAADAIFADPYQVIEPSVAVIDFTSTSTTVVPTLQHYYRQQA